MALNFEPDWVTIISSSRTSTCTSGIRYRLSNTAPKPGLDSTRVRKGVFPGGRLRSARPFIALQDSLLQRTSSILHLFCNEPLLLAYLSVM
jgi:hypothetical protein